MSTNFFRLHPSNPNVKLTDEKKLVKLLVDIGLISYETYDDGFEIRYLPGKNFYNLFEDKEGTIGKEYRAYKLMYTTRILKAKTDKPLVIHGGEYSKPPNCPNCAYAHEQFGDLISEWWENPSDFRWQCPECEHSYQIENLDWHNSMGFATYAIDIIGIGWHQVTPSRTLLDALKDFAGVEFSYVYKRI